MITVAIGTTSSPAEAKGKDTDTQRRRGSLLDAKIAPQGALLQANLQIWPHVGKNTGGAAWSGVMLANVMAHRCLK